MAYIVVRNKSSGYVSCVEKKRVKNPDGSSSVRDVARVCGLGTMTQKEFETFRDWAHGFKDQKERKAQVLSSGMAITEETKVLKKSKKAEKKVRKSTRSKVQKKPTVPELRGYHRGERTQTHTQIMMERFDDNDKENHRHTARDPRKRRSHTEEPETLGNIHASIRHLETEAKKYDTTDPKRAASYRERISKLKE